jgi:16S rRNA (cytosine1402-N4)-methyltransferase
MHKIHIPVLLEESIASLAIKPNGFYIDCTLGDGGHSIEMLRRLSNDGMLLSIDRDQNAIDFVHNFYTKESQQANWKIVKANFKDLDKEARDIRSAADGILMDLGLSSRQLEESHNRGFSYQEDNEPLDMRMDTELGVTAKDLLNVFSEKELYQIFKTYGEEKYSYQIAKAIKKNISDINTVGDLTRLIYKVMPAVNLHKNPSRRVFQALRIVVNDELNSLGTGLDNSFKILKKGGRLSVISFHSLEDRIVKQFFLDKSRSGEGEFLFKNHIAPTDEEEKQNPRSASAKLRTLTKHDNP